MIALLEDYEVAARVTLNPNNPPLDLSRHWEQIEKGRLTAQDWEDHWLPRILNGSLTRRELVESGMPVEMFEEWVLSAGHQGLWKPRLERSEKSKETCADRGDAANDLRWCSNELLMDTHWGTATEAHAWKHELTCTRHLQDGPREQPRFPKLRFAVESLWRGLVQMGTFWQVDPGPFDPYEATEEANGPGRACADKAGMALRVRTEEWHLSFCSQGHREKLDSRFWKDAEQAVDRRDVRKRTNRFAMAAIAMVTAMSSEAQPLDISAYDAYLITQPDLSVLLRDGAEVERDLEHELARAEHKARATALERWNLELEAHRQQWTKLQARHHAEWEKAVLLIEHDRRTLAQMALLGALSDMLFKLGLQSLADDIQTAAKGEGNVPSVEICDDNGCVTLTLQPRGRTASADAGQTTLAPPPTQPAAEPTSAVGRTGTPAVHTQMSGVGKRETAPLATGIGEALPDNLAEREIGLSRVDKLLLLGPEIPQPVVDWLE